MSRKPVLCNIPNCKETALYGVNDDKNKPYWCETHMNEIKESNPEELFLCIKLHKKTCKDKLCKKDCSFNYVGKKFGIFCKTHALKDMKNITVEEQCLGIINDERCTKIPSYGLIGGTSLKDALYCSSCYKKLPDKDKYEDVAHKKCLGVDEDGKRCKKVPCYGSPGKPPSHCFVHAPEGMKNVANDYCSYTETIAGEVKKCEIVATYGLIGTKKRLYCHQHSIIKGGCEDLAHRKCIYEKDGIKCESRALFGIKEESIKQYCKIHSKSDMVYKDGATCFQCSKRALYGFIKDNKRIACLEHRSSDMIDLNHKRCVSIDSTTSERCLETPIYNYEYLDSADYCCFHKTDDMVHKHERICKTFMCCTSITNSYSKDYCSRCFVHLFPESVQSTNYRTKELEVVQFIKKHFDVEMDCNKKIKDGTSLRRPDIIIYIENYSIIIEIDEHRHSSYECECQNRRIMEISQDLKFQNTIFIRFNPDSYLNLESKRIPSCWSYDSKGKIYITNKEDWNQRLSVLKNTIEYWLQNPPEKMIETIQLFYDQNIDID